jgi:hypothetical protein
VGLKDRLKRATRANRKGLDSFALADDSVYYYDPRTVSKELFLYTNDIELGRAADWDEPPEILRAIAKAKDPAIVLGRFRPANPQAFVNLHEVIDINALVHERKVVPALPEDDG